MPTKPDMCHKMGHIGGKRSLEGERLTTGGMGEGETGGVQ